MIRVASIFSLLAISAAAFSSGVESRAWDLSRSRYSGLPANATHCDPSLPIFVELDPIAEPAVGQASGFEAKVQSILDPDLVERSWIEWEVPARVRRVTAADDRREILDHTGRGRSRLDVVIPDGARYSIRARFVVRLKSGETMAQTAVRWVNLGGEARPEGMIGRIESADGAGILVYRGSTIRN